MERKWMIPEWNGSPFQKWAKNFCSKNQWRVAQVLGEYEDCLSYCAMCYVICSQRYGSTVNDPKQFMYMYKVWVTMEFNTMSTQDSKKREAFLLMTKEEESVESDANLAVKLSEASSELKSVINMLMSAPQEIMEILRADANSCNPKQFWKGAVALCGISKTKSSALAKELQQLLK